MKFQFPTTYHWYVDENVRQSNEQQVQHEPEKSRYERTHRHKVHPPTAQWRPVTAKWTRKRQ